MTNISQLEAGNLLNQLTASIFHLRDSFGKTSFLAFLPVFIGLFLVLILLILRKAFLLKKSLDEKSVLLELTPPSFTEKEAYTTEQLFSLIHALGNQRSFTDRLIGNKTRFSLEIVSTQKEGIRYLVRTTQAQVNTLRRSLLSYLPQLKVKTVSEYLPENIEPQHRIIEFKLSRHFAYPLKKHDELYKHDPIAYITGMMTKLLPDELVSLQIVLTPTKSKETRKISKLILHNGDVVHYLNSIKFLRLISRAPSKTTGTRTLFEQELMHSIDVKIDQPLFETTTRILLVFKDEGSLTERAQGLKSSFATFSTSGYQSIKPKRYFNLNFIRKYLFFVFKKRLLSFTNKSLLSVSEVSDIYHFPYTSITKTEDLVKVHSKELPAPLSLKKGHNLDVIYAKNNYGGTTTQIGLTKEERVRHMYVIGATGTGKSTMILSMAKQDMQNGKGVSVIDPHGDLAESLLTLVPEKRKDDLIYFNPDDIKHPIGLNLLELTPGLDEDEMLREKELITEGVISLFRKIFSEVWSAHAHRLEYLLRNTMQTALTLENPTIFTVYDLLNNPDYQKKVIQGLEDENLKNFWKYEFGKAGDYQRVKMVGPVTARIGRFLFSPTAKRIMEQTKSTINFDNILDDGKILICNLSKGKIGEDTSEVLGIMILTKIQLASLKRARTQEKNRAPFYLYVDEFQNFATPSFIQMLSEARKYGLNLTMAEQSTSQQKDKNLVNVLLANVGTVVCFRSANPQDEVLMLPQFAPYIDKGEISNLPSFHFYSKIAAINPEEPFSGETVPVEITFDKNKIEKLIQLSRDRNAIIYQKPIVKKSAVEPKAEVSDNSKNTMGSNGLPKKKPVQNSTYA
ncbi:MAG: type IV secretion system DNA-binding domain-containing protein [Candidatus Levyibacteriota bacterium]